MGGQRHSFKISLIVAALVGSTLAPALLAPTVNSSAAATGDTAPSVVGSEFGGPHGTGIVGFDANGSNPRIIVAGDFLMGLWSAGGSRFSFAGWTGSAYQTEVANADGSNRTVVALVVRRGFSEVGQMQIVSEQVAISAGQSRPIKWPTHH